LLVLPIALVNCSSVVLPIVGIAHRVNIAHRSYCTSLVPAIALCVGIAHRLYCLSLVLPIVGIAHRWCCLSLVLS
jgi:hypothetical protein